MYQFVHLDASESVYFNRQLEDIKAQTYDIKYPDKIARTLVPVDNSGPSAKRVVTYRQWDRRGVAKMISSYGDDLPRVDVLAKEFSVTCKSMAVAYGFSLEEIRESAQFGTNLDAKKAEAARNAIEEMIEKVAKTGDASTGLLGLFNQPSTNTHVLPTDGSGASATFGSKTPDQVLRDLHAIAKKCVEATNDVEKADTMLLPLTSHGDISTRRMGDGSDVTILEFFLKTSPYIRTVVPWFALETAGAGSVKRIICYRRQSNALELLIPQEFEQLPPQVKNLETVVPCHARTGGVLVYYPLSITYCDGA